MLNILTAQCDTKACAVEGFCFRELYFTAYIKRMLFCFSVLSITLQDRNCPGCDELNQPFNYLQIVGSAHTKSRGVIMSYHYQSRTSKDQNVFRALHFMLLLKGIVRES